MLRFTVSPIRATWVLEHPFLWCSSFRFLCVFLVIFCRWVKLLHEAPCSPVFNQSNWGQNSCPFVAPFWFNAICLSMCIGPMHFRTTCSKVTQQKTWCLSRYVREAEEKASEKNIVNWRPGWKSVVRCHKLWESVWAMFIQYHPLSMSTSRSYSAQYHLKKNYPSLQMFISEHLYPPNTEPLMFLLPQRVKKLSSSVLSKWVFHHYKSHFSPNSHGTEFLHLCIGDSRVVFPNGCFQPTHLGERWETKGAFDGDFDGGFWWGASPKFQQAASFLSYWWGFFLRSLWTKQWQ